MAGGLSIHVVDVSRGIVAAGMRVDVHRCAPPTLLASGAISARGTLDVGALAEPMTPGFYEAVFHVAAFYGTAGIVETGVPFLDVVTYRFGIADPQQHYHLPMKLTPWGYSCFRGGQ
jgi:5-hydroxyisourate hydrolase